MTSPPECTLYSPCWYTEITLLSEDFAKTVTPVLVFLAIFMVSGVVGNIILLVVYTKKKAKTSADYYVLILGYIDLTSSLLVNPYMMYKLTHNYLQDWGWLCKFFEFFAHLSLASSASVFCVIAIDRFYAVCKPLKFRNTLKLMKILLSVLMPLGFLASLPILEFVGERIASVRSLDGRFEIRTIACNFKNSYSDSVALTTFRVTSAIAFIVTAIVISVLYARVSLTAYRRARARVKPSPRNKGVDPSLQNPAVGKQGITGTSHRRDMTVSVILVTSVDPTITGADEKGIGVVTSDASKSIVSGINQSGNIPDGNVTDRCSTIDSSEMRRGNTHPRGAADEAKKTTTVSVNSLGKLFQKSQNKNRSRSSSLHAAKMLFAAIASFFIGWSPYWILVVLHNISENIWVMQSTADIVGYQLLIHLYYVNNSVHPVIFALYNKQFRQDCRDIFKGLWSRRS